MRSVRARTSAAWLHAGSVLWALVDHHVGAELRARARGRAGWKPKCAAQAASTTSGTSCACAAVGQPGDVAHRADVGRVAHEDRPRLGVRGERAAYGRRGTPSGRPVPGSTSGRTHTGVRPASTSRAASSGAACGSPPRCRRRRPTASATAWLAWVAPPVENRQTSAPQSRAARASASARTPAVSFIVSSPA